MSHNHGPKIVRDGLLNCYDASNPKSYPGSGTVWTDLVSKGSINLSNLYSFDSGIALNTRSNTFATVPFTFGYNMTFELWYKTYQAATGFSTQFQSPGIIQLGTYASSTSFTLWDWSVNTVGVHNIRTYVANGSVWSYVIDPPRTFTDSEWLKYHHIVMVFNGATGWTSYSLYIDTVLMFTQSITPAVTSLSGGNNVIFPGANGGYENNSYSSLKIYNKSLSQNEIIRNYNATKRKFGL